jgi:hypothetical protein
MKELNRAYLRNLAQQMVLMEREALCNCKGIHSLHYPENGSLNGKFLHSYT